MRVHEAKYFPGGIVASLAIPWGFARGDGHMGYHLVWARDMIQTVGGLLAIEKHEDARRVLFYFEITQEADGHWPQNMFLDGRPSWNGIQLDETAFVILLVNMARRHKALSAEQQVQLWPMVRRAAAFLVCHGPVSPMDRWEEQPGYYASTMAVEIPALLVAAEVGEAAGEKAIAAYLRETADIWNDTVEELLYVRGTDLARELGVDGYYARFALPDQLEKPTPAYGTVQLRNYPKGQGKFKLADIVSPDALCLVRYGLRAADDPRIVNTVKVIDHTLKVDTPTGPCWHRYSHDGYGEHADGAPFDGTGIGRAWPLLTGERGHYELAAGRKKEAKKLAMVMETFANDSGLLPEQIWDTADIPERELYFGRPSGSAMPLVWAHAEYVKLRRSLHDGRVFDMPPQSFERYVKKPTAAPHAFWRPDQKRRSLKAGKILRVELPAAAVVRWSDDCGRTHGEVKTRDTGLGIHFADLPTVGVAAGGEVAFTIRGAEKGPWEGQEFRVRVEG
jgi:glucoamylase